MNNTVITKDLAKKQLHVTHQFAASLEKVWRAWTESSILDKWWAPKPWRAVTKSLDFKSGGRWIYNMLGPDGNGAWCRVDFNSVTPQNNFTTSVYFCDEDGNINKDFPTMHWLIKFEADRAGTNVAIDISFDNEADLQKIVEMGFEAGFTMGLGNLDELLEA
jgi:uncharacterized protein YndB with AHSA1/START domain